MMTAQSSMFKTPKRQAGYFAAYDAALALWPVPVDSFDVSTCFGTTHCHVCGPENGPPLVLLPGQAISATMWYPNIAALSRIYRVYALDILGDVGKSVRTRPLTTPADFGHWLIEVFDQLGLDQAHVAGLSYGGFLAIRLAIFAPERVNKLVLMAPASLLRIRWRFFLRMAVFFLPDFLISLEVKQKLFLGIHSPQALPVIHQMRASKGFQYDKDYLYLPPVCTDEALQQIKAPTLLLLGDHEIIYDIDEAIDRAKNLIPTIETAVIPNAGHVLSLDQPDLVNRRILAFLGES